MENQERICRFCFEKCDTNFRAIEGSTHEVLNMLLVTINLAISDEPVMCTKCSEILQKCFVFKKTCLDVRDHAVAFGNDKNNGHVVCEFCMNLLENCSFTILDTKENISAKKMLEKYFPQLDLSASKEPVICEVCHGTLVIFLSFLTMSSIVEEKIKRYCDATGGNDINPIKLNNVLLFTSENVWKENDNELSVYKMEETISVKNENQVSVINVGYIQTPGINIKGQIELSSSLQLTIREVDDNSADIIKVKEEFCEDGKNPDEREIGNGEDTTILEQISLNDREDANNVMKHEEDDPVETEEKTFLLNEDFEIKTDEHDFDIPEHSIVHKNTSKVTMYNCDYCSFQTKRKSNLKYHILIHKDSSEVTMYTCDSCSFQTKRKNNLKSHALTHKDPSELTIYKCDSCSFQAKRKSNLKNHTLTHKDPSEMTIYKCDSCSFQTKRKSNLKSHMLTHKDPAEVTVYKCDHCSFQTKRKSNLKDHCLTHKDPSEITMYKCEYCSIQAKRKRDLKKHMLLHEDPSEVTMYKCDNCSFQTKFKSSLKNHCVTHKDPSEITMYKCEYCSIQAKRKGDLKKHMLLHENPSEGTMYKCDNCSFQTKLKYSLKNHLLTHKDPSEVIMYECGFCSF